MAEMTAEKFAQRVFDYDLVDAHQLESIWGEIGSRDVPLDRLTGLMVRRELLTNFQVERILSGKRDGYFYGNYKVLYLVGSGTFARVYRAVHRQTNKVRAVKVLRQRYSDDLVTTEQFLREARMVMPLRHPNIVPVYEVEQERRRVFMVMDFIEGQNLRDFIKVRKKLDLLNSLRLLSDVLAGLNYALGKGVTHRDMKLSNVLISSHGRAKLVDFGLAAISADMTEAAIAAAPNPRSIDYAGLERATGVRKNDKRSDIYFAGCMMYHMLAGRSPLFETRDRIQRLSIMRYREIKPLSQLEPDLPNYVVAFVNRAMDLKVERRYQNPAQMGEDLNRVVERIKSGDSGNVESPHAEEPREDAPANKETILVREGESRKVMIVESNVDMQNALRNALKKRGYRVLVFGNPDRVLQRFEEHDDPDPFADAIIVCADELGAEAVDLFNSLGQKDETKDVPTILLISRSQKEQIRRAAINDHRVILPMGIKIKQLRAMLLKLLRQRQLS